VRHTTCTTTQSEIWERVGEVVFAAVHATGLPLEVAFDNVLAAENVVLFRKPWSTYSLLHCHQLLRLTTLLKRLVGVAVQYLNESCSKPPSLPILHVLQQPCGRACAPESRLVAVDDQGGGHANGR